MLAIAVSHGLGNRAGADLADADVVGLGERVVAAAHAQLGKPYVFGAAGPDVFDCSGLVQWVFRQVGITAPRSAQGQSDWVRPVPVAEVRIAGLVFFHSTYPSQDYVTHVGIYVGNGQMIVAPRTGEAVRLESLASPYWRLHFAGVGRPPFPGEGDGQGLVLHWEVGQ